MSTSDTTNQSATGRSRKAPGSAAAANAESAAPAKKRMRQTAALVEQAQQVPAPAADAQDGQSHGQTGPLCVEPTLHWDEGQWRQRVAEAAYFRAERRGFTGGSPEQDWYEAEDELRRGPDETRA